MKTSTKIFVWILVAIGLAAFFFLAIGITLMLAPGLEIFGIKYISSKVGKYQYTNDCSAVFSSSSITLNAGEVPITVAFGESGSMGLTFVQNFQGYTKSSDTANAKITKNNTNNTAVIDITEYKKFIWANSMQEFYLTLKIPSTYYGSLTINTTNSSVNMKSAVGGTNLSALTINTKNKIDFNKGTRDKFNIAGDFKFSTKSSLYLGSNMTFGGNIVANLSNDSLTIESPVAKDITFTSNAGDLYFNTCKNLKVTTNSGHIRTLKTGSMPNSISGNLNVTTNSGKVEIGSVLGATNTISDRSGDVAINKVNGSLEIKTLRSNITLGEVVNAHIIADGNGSVVINKATGGLTARISGLSGGVTCGSVSGAATVSTRNGAIKINGTISGTLTATTEGGAITIGTVNSTAKIITNNGAVTIDSLKGTDNTIKNSYGYVKVETVTKDVSVSNIRSAVYNFGTVGTLDFNGTNSSLTVGGVTTRAKVKTSANVTIGSDDNDVADVDINAGTGNVTLKNTIGTVRVASQNKTITLSNKSSEDIKINKIYNTSKSKWEDVANASAVNATGLKGKVEVCSSFRINLTFSALTDNVDVTSKRSETVKIDATCVSYNTVNYNLNTHKNSALCTVYHGTHEAVENGSGTSYASNSSGSTYKTIRVSTDGAPIELKLAG